MRGMLSMACVCGVAYQLLFVTCFQSYYSNEISDAHADHAFFRHATSYASDKYEVSSQKMSFGQEARCVGVLAKPTPCAGLEELLWARRILLGSQPQCSQM